MHSITRVGMWILAAGLFFWGTVLAFLSGFVLALKVFVEVG